MCLYLWVSWLFSFVGSVKILKHSARFSLHVIVALNTIVSLFWLATWFLVFSNFVSNRPSGGSWLVGLCFAGMRFSLVSASCAQLCGCLHPWSLSALHSWQSHSWFCWWSGYCWGWRIRADILTRSATVEALCFLSRQRALALFMDIRSADRWYHASNCSSILGDILIVATVHVGHFRHLTKGKYYYLNYSFKIPPNHLKPSAFGSHLEVVCTLFSSFLK